MSRAAIAVMARYPEPGKAKTRLQPHLTPDQCAKVYAAFLEDAIDLAASLEECSSFLAFTPPEAHAFFESLTPEGMELMTQVGVDLGLRMYNILNTMEKRGFSPVAVIGSDIPLLQPSVLSAGLERLKSFDVCLGPSRDGGYYLIGMGHVQAALFSGIPWSTSDVFSTTLQKAHETGLSVALLEQQSDVDTFDDLRQLSDSLHRLQTTPGARLPRSTLAWMEANRDSLHETSL